jgi:hypothetical protein
MVCLTFVPACIPVSGRHSVTFNSACRPVPWQAGRQAELPGPEPQQCPPATDKEIWPKIFSKDLACHISSLKSARILFLPLPLPFLFLCFPVPPLFHIPFLLSHIYHCMLYATHSSSLSYFLLLTLVLLILPHFGQSCTTEPSIVYFYSFLLSHSPYFCFLYLIRMLFFFPFSLSSLKSFFLSHLCHLFLHVFRTPLTISSSPSPPYFKRRFFPFLSGYPFFLSHDVKVCRVLRVRCGSLGCGVAL